jgi:hypothetical protein
LSASYGYNFVFIFSLIVGLIGIVLLVRTPNPSAKKLALSSK